MASNPAFTLSFKDRLLAWFLSWVGWSFLHFVGKTSRIRCHYDPAVRALREEGKPFIYALWHRTQLMLIYVHRSEDVRCLISLSRDGEFVARAAERLGFRPVRGSSSRGGARALLEIIDHLKNGHRVSFTPDGPRGPVKSVHPGVVAAARKSGMPVVAIGWAGTRSKILNSWDRFIVPLPFARWQLAYPAPVRIGPDDADGEAKIRAALDEAERKAAELLAEWN